MAVAYGQDSRQSLVGLHGFSLTLPFFLPAFSLVFPPSSILSCCRPQKLPYSLTNKSNTYAEELPTSVTHVYFFSPKLCLPSAGAANSHASSTISKWSITNYILAQMTCAWRKEGDLDKLHSVLTLEQVFMDELAVYKGILGTEDEHLLLLEGEKSGEMLHCLQCVHPHLLR